MLAVAIAYADSFHGPMFFDDVFSIRDNYHLRAPTVLTAAARSAFSTPHSPLTSRPVTSLTFALNYAWGELDVWGYHAVNLALHLGSSLLAWGVVRRTLSAPKMPADMASAAPWLATAVAVLWAVHPLNTETVVYLTQRTTLLKSFFFLAMFYAAIRAWDSPRAGAWSALAVVACALGMGSKETMVGTPILVMLYDGVFLAPSWREAWRRRWPLYAGLAATWGLLAAFVALGPRNTTVGFDLASVTPWQYLMTQAAALLHYLRLTVWPHPLVVTYDWPVVKELKYAAAPGLVILALLAMTVIGLVWRRWWAWCGACCFMVLAPTSSILPIATELLAERRMYLPLLSLILLFVVGAWSVLNRLPLRPPIIGRLATALTVLVASAAIWTSADRIADYSDEQTIWLDTIAKSPRSDIAQNNLACHLFRAGREEEAVKIFEHVVTDLNPDNAQAHASLAAAYFGFGRHEAAEIAGRTAMRLNPRLAGVRSNLALAISATGKLEEAMRHLNEELALTPGYAEAWNTLGIIRARQRQFAEARSAFETAIGHDRRDPRFHRNHCQTFLDEAVSPDGTAHVARLHLAVQRFRGFTSTYPRDNDGRRRLAFALSLLGHHLESLREWEICLQLRPDDPVARENIARLRAIIDKTSGHADVRVR